MTSKRFRKFSITKVRTLFLLLILATLAQVGTYLSNNSPSNFTNIIYWSPDSPLFRGPANERMFTHETSGKGHLNRLQTCTVESAAKHNPTRPIQVFIQKEAFLLNGAKHSSLPWLEILSQYPNVFIVLINETNYFKDTPLQNWYNEGLWKGSEHRIEHLSDYIRMLSSWRNGGLYFDLDIIFRKPINLDEFNNFLLCEDPFCESLNNGMFHFDHAHVMSLKILENLAKGYKAKLYSENGPFLINRLMRDRCKFKKSFPFSNKCDDVSILPPTLLYSTQFSEQELFYEREPKHALKWLLPAYGVHMWNHLSRNKSLDVNSNYLFEALAAESCPLTVKLS